MTTRAGRSQAKVGDTRRQAVPRGEAGGEGVAGVVVGPREGRIPATAGSGVRPGERAELPRAANGGTEDLNVGDTTAVAGRDVDLAGVGPSGHVTTRRRRLERRTNGPRTGIVVDEVGYGADRRRRHRTAVNAAASIGVVRDHRDSAGEIVRTQTECATACLGGEPTERCFRGVGDGRDGVSVVGDRWVVRAGLTGIDAVAVERPIGGVENVGAPVVRGVAAVGTVTGTCRVRGGGDTDCRSEHSYTDEWNE